MSNTYQGIADSYLPANINEPLRQYDNYQIYDLVCVDVGSGDNINKQTSFLAIQAYSVDSITCNFIEIAIEYK